MKKDLLLIVVILLTVGACYNDDVANVVLIDENASTRTEEEQEKSNIHPLTTQFLLETYIQKIKLANFEYGKNLRKKVRETPSYRLIPYVYKEDTVMYVAQYSDGWELLSTDERTPIVLASSEIGIFDTDSLPHSILEYITTIAQDIATLKETENKDSVLNEEWDIVHAKIGEGSSVNVTSSDELIGNGEWVLMDSYQVNSNIETIDHLITSHWHQYYPYNIFTPKYNIDGIETHYSAGCAPVAAGQYLKFYAKKFNKNATWMIPSPPADENDFELLYNSSTNKYSFTNETYGMVALENSGLKCPRAAYFVGYLGSIMGTVYNADGSTTSPNEMLTGINHFISPNYSIHDMNENIVISKLQSGMPVLASATGQSNGEDGHAFIIDKYKIRTEKWAMVYGWVGEDSEGNPTNEYDNNGEIIGYTYTKTEYKNVVKKTISMNWGDRVTSYDDLEFSATASDWIMGDYNYKFRRKIYY